jgi:hypothetical protein
VIADAAQSGATAGVLLQLSGSGSKRTSL